jgi:predicted nucleic-acid-binding protein
LPRSKKESRHRLRGDEQSQGAEEIVMVEADTYAWSGAGLNDNTARTRKTRRALAHARSKGDVLVPLIVLADLAWVLGSIWERDRVLTALESMLQTRGIAVEAPGRVRKALEVTGRGKGRF